MQTILRGREIERIQKEDKKKNKNPPHTALLFITLVESDGYNKIYKWNIEEKVLFLNGLLKLNKLI